MCKLILQLLHSGAMFKFGHDQNCFSYLPKFLESKFYIKCQVDYFTNNDGVSLHDILNNHSALFYFMEVQSFHES